MSTATMPSPGIAAKAWRIPDQYKVICPVCLERRLPVVLEAPEELDADDSDTQLYHLMEYYPPGNPLVPSGIFLDLGAHELGVYQCTLCGDYCLATPAKQAQAQSLIERIVCSIQAQQACNCGQH